MATYTGTTGNDSYGGTADNDLISGGEGNDTLRGADGNDTLLGDTGNDVMDGGPGFDTLDYSAANGTVSFNFVTGDVFGTSGLGLDTSLGIEAAIGGAFNDRLVGSGGDESLRGGDGNDELAGGGGNDTLRGEGGNDTFIVANGVTLADGGAGDDLMMLVSGFSSFTITRPAVDTLRLVHNTLPQQITLSGVERISFDLVIRFASTLLANTPLSGTPGNDTIEGGTGDDAIDGLAGDDSLSGLAGNDTLISGSGNDTLDGGAGTDTAQLPLTRAAYGVGRSGGDLVLTGSDGSSVRLRSIESVQFSDATLPIATVEADTGQVYTGTSGNDSRDGGAGNDNLNGAGGNDTLRGLGGSDTLDGGAGNDTLYGGDGSDLIRDTAGQDRVFPGLGSDTVIGNTSVSTLGTDGEFLEYSDLAVAIEMDLSGISGDGSVGSGVVRKGAGGASGIDQISNIPFFTLTPQSDRVLGSSARRFEQFNPLNGNDTIDGGAIEPVFFPSNHNRLSGGGNGELTIDLRAGTATSTDGFYGTKALTNISDVRGSNFADLIYGSDQTVWVERFDGGGGGTNDTIDGRGGFDFIITNSATAAMLIDLAAGTALDGNGGTDTLINIEFASASGFNDTVRGSAGPNLLQGQNGDDLIEGRAGDDTIDGGGGNDTASYAGAGAGVVVNLLGGAATGGDGTDALSNIEHVTGSAFDDALIGNTSANSLVGGAGNDSIFGGAGSDTLVGGPGNDTLDGGVITDRPNYSDLTQISYAAAPAGIVVDLSGITGDGSSGSGTALDGEGGTDVLRNVTRLLGSAFADRFTGSNAFTFEVYSPGAGDDTIDGGLLADPLIRSTKRVQYNDAPASVTVDLAAGTASGGGGNDRLSNVNALLGSNFNDTLLGSDRGDAMEQFAGGAGIDSIDGRGGTDLLRYDIVAATTGVVVDMRAGTTSNDGRGASDSFANIEIVYGSALADSITGRDDVPDTIEGFAGNDTLAGGAGPGDWLWFRFSTSGVNVVLPGSIGGTIRDGQGGTDVITGFEAVRGSNFADVLTGSEATNVIETFEGGAGNDTIDGRAVTDVASYEHGSSAGAVVDLEQGIASNDGFGDTDTLLNIENVTGTLLFGDQLRGNNTSNLLSGLGGNDTLLGLFGADTLVPGTGTDSVDGGEKVDTLQLIGPRAAYTFTVLEAGDSSGNGLYRLVSAAHQQAVDFRSIERVAFSDVTVAMGELLNGSSAGTAAADSLTGMAGNDTLVGLGEADSLHGGAGNDSLDGGEGDDTLNGGTGTDFVNGGDGQDRIEFIGARAGFVISQPTPDTIRLVNATSNEDVTTRNVERFRFSDAGPISAAPLLLGGSTNPSGTPLADNIVGSDGNDLISGGASADRINGGAGNDTLLGGAEEDVLIGGAGVDLVSWEDAPSGVTANLATSVVRGGSGNDVLFGDVEILAGSAFNDTLTGDAGVNGLIGLEGDDVLDGGGAEDLLAGRDGNDTLRGGAGDDTLEGDAGNDVLDGGADRDELRPGAGNDTLTGAALGSRFDDLGDKLSYASLGAVGVVVDFSAIAQHGDAGTVRKGAGGALGTDRVVMLRHLELTAGNDRVLGSAGAFVEFFEPGAGDDTLDGGTIVADEAGEIVPRASNVLSFNRDSAPMVVDIAAGTATGLGSKTFTNFNAVEGSDGDDRLLGSNQAAWPELFSGDSGNDTLDGRGGIDVAYYGGADSGVNVNLALGTARDQGGGTDTLLNIEWVQGGDANDTLTGDAGANRLLGGPGLDSIEGGDGNDTLEGGDGNDTMHGGAGVDWASWRDATAGISVNLGAGSGAVQGGGASGDVLSGIEAVLGSAFNDTVTGDAGNNTIEGRNGADSLRGGAGDDLIVGGAGRDSLRGDGGNDTLDGGTVTDRVFYTDLNFISYFDEPAAIRIDFSGISGDGSVGFGTVTKQSGADRLINISFLAGTSYADTFIGSTALVFEQFEGRAGDDTINGGGPITDRVFNRDANRANYENAPLAVNGDLAAGRVTGGDGTDTLINITQLRGSAHNDTLSGSNNVGYNEFFEGRAGSDTIDGRGGLDTVRFDDARTGVVANLATGVAQDGYGTVDTLISIEGLFGSAFDDLLVGGAELNGTTAIGNRRSDGIERLDGRGGNDTLDGGAGFDRADYATAPAGIVATLGGSNPGTASDGFGGTDTLINIEAVRGSRSADSITGSASNFWEIFHGLNGNDTIDGGDVNRDPLARLDQFDGVDYRNDETGVSVNLLTGTATDGFGDTDTLRGIEFIFGSLFADTVRGADGPANARGDTVRGFDGNDSIDGGAGVDTAEFLGNRADYTVTRINATTWTVRDNNTADGDEGTDTLSNIERFVFNDETLAFGPRAEELARVAAVLWSPAIIGSSTLFSRGFSYYDNGYGLADMSRAALQFWTAQSDAQLAQLLATNSGSTTKTAADFLNTITGNGGGSIGRAAAVREAAADAGVSAFITQSGVQDAGVVSLNNVPGFGYLFDLWGG